MNTANFVVVAGAYGYAFLVDSDDDDQESQSKQPEWLKFIYKSLDFGSGRERGARKQISSIVRTNGEDDKLINLDADNYCTWAAACAPSRTDRVTHSY